MKKIFVLIGWILVTVYTFAQSPQAFKYQAIARNNSGEVLTEQPVSLKISLLQDAIDGTAVYVETYNTTSNDFGLINLEIGNGIPESGDFSTIDWGSHSFFVKIEMDETGGTNYQFMGISKLLSVPYALYAGKTGVTTLTGHSATELDDITSTGNGAIITDTERTNFTSAYNWGDHALAGYLISYTETDPKIGTNTTNYLSKWNGSALVSSAIFDNNNIGIGTNSPVEALDVNGALRIGTTNNLNAGAIRFNNDVFQGYNGTEWLQLSGGSGTPWITSGSDVYYNSGNVGINITNPTTELDVNGVITATGGTSANWNTAFGWGDHSLAGYLESYTETDPVFGAHTANGITSTNITNWTAAYGWGDHSIAGYLTSYTETDPIFVAHAANGITSTNITNWTAAYGWGDHSTVGYLTSYTETDPVFTTHIVNGITASDTTNWSIAFGWGNHSTVGYLTSYTETDPQVGSNTTNFLSKWNGSALVSSIIFDNGNIGIGTTSPGGLLGLSDANTYFNVDGSNNLTLTDAVTGTKTLAQLSSSSADFSNGGEAGGADRTLGNTDNYGLGFKTNNSIRMFIDSLGNVGIGTTNPEAKFTIVQDGDNWNDGLRFDNSTTIWDFNIHSDSHFYIGKDSQKLLEINTSGSNTGLFINSPTGSNSHIKFLENNTIKMEIGYSASGDYLYMGDAGDENGSINIEQTTRNVGIGTTSPKNKLDIEGGAVIGATYSGTNTAPSNGLLVEGNVGIGTNNPGYKLDIYEASGVLNQRLHSDGGGVTLVLDKPTSANDAKIHFQTNGVTNFEIGVDDIPENMFKIGRSNNKADFVVDETGNIGINTTSPSGLFHVQGGTTGSADSSFVVLDNGNVGIGTTSPSEKLEVNGAIKGFGIVPIGTVQAWLESYSNTPTLPDGWVECNGQTLNDAESPYNGQVIPNLNGENRFLRGNSTSGTTGGNSTLSLTIEDGNAGSSESHYWSWNSGTSSSGSDGTDIVSGNGLPPYYEIVWIMRVK